MTTKTNSIHLTADNIEDQLKQLCKKRSLEVDTADYFGDAAYFTFKGIENMYMVASIDDRKRPVSPVDEIYLVALHTEVFFDDDTEEVLYSKTHEFHAYNGMSITDLLKVVKKGSFEAYKKYIRSERLKKKK